MQPEQPRKPIRPDPETQKVMDVGVTQFFAPREITRPVRVREKLLEAAERMENFLSGPGKNSDFALFFDDLDTAGLRSCAEWIDDSVYLSSEDFDELFSIATSGNVRPFPGQSESDVYGQFRARVEAFVAINGFDKGV